ncbi:MAG: serine/threonine protein kinase [Myxococcales bacterium]|nr:serine/threonine protein kinase [Myxococcales bacterium]
MAQSPQGAPIDRYVVLEYLAEGGMGAIYLGKKMGAGGFEKQVVLKQLLPEFTKQPEFIDLFLREARLSATLDHANIIHTIDLVTAGEEHFIVMEYLDGADLRSILKRTKHRGVRLSPAAGIYVARELLSALAYAHNKHGSDGKHLRLIHRDISPSNILISRNGEVKLTDFGIAKAATHNSVSYRVKGKVGYMSPEQARSETLDARSDLHSMAVCLFEMLTGERLLVTAGITTSADELYSKPVPLVSKKVRGLPAELDKVMLRALSVDPAHRYQTAAEFQEALLRCAHRQGLMMSAPELATHLRSVCGDHSSWRKETDEVPLENGTELYDHEEDHQEGVQQIDYAEEDGDYEDADMLSIVDGEDVKAGERRHERAQTSLSLLGNLKGMELTSLALLGDSSGEGARPLVDLNSSGPATGTTERETRASRPAPRRPVDRVLEGRHSTPPRMEAATQNADEYTGVVIVQGSGRSESHTGEVVDQPTDRPSTRAESEWRGPDEKGATSGHSWLMLTLIVLLGIGTATAIGLTGSRMDTSEPSGSEAAAPRPSSEKNDR